MFGISGFELLIIAAFVVIIFGPDKLPDLARMAGKAMRSFKRAQEDMERVIKAEMYAPGQDNENAAATFLTDTPSPAAPAPAATSAVTAAQIWEPDEDDAEEEEEE